jgi:AcrR family transcriptional regulator
MALSRDDWIRAALVAIAERGSAEVAVERLALQLGATKGSFYWHFRDRGELVAEALALWEREGTDDFITRFAPVADPVERLRLVLTAAMEDEDNEHGPADAALIAAGADPTITPVVDRVQRKRLAFIEGCFRDMGFPPAESRHRARIGYSIYLGWYAQLPADRGAAPLARERAAYERIAVDLLARPR